MKGDESRTSKKGQERGARRGPGGESTGGRLDLPHQAPAEPHRQIPLCEPSVLQSLPLPARAALGHGFGQGLRKIRRTETELKLLKLAQLEPASPFFCLGTASPPPPCPSTIFLYLRGRSWLWRNMTRGCSRAGPPGAG